MTHLVPVFKLLSDETRLRIIVLLSQDSLCVCQLTGVLKLAQPKVSKALAKLRDLNLVNDERREKFVYYSLNESNPMLNHILQHINDSIEHYEQLSEDSKGLADKATYVAQCSTTTLNI